MSDKFSPTYVPCLNVRPVDGTIAEYLGWLVDMTISMLIKFASVIVISPSVLLPGLIISVLGAWCGQLYIKAQLSVKREMSNARAPVLGHFGAAVAGLSKLFSRFGARDTSYLLSIKHQFVHTALKNRSGSNHISVLINSLVLLAASTT